MNRDHRHSCRCVRGLPDQLFDADPVDGMVSVPLRLAAFDSAGIYPCWRS